MILDNCIRVTYNNLHFVSLNIVLLSHISIASYLSALKIDKFYILTNDRRRLRLRVSLNLSTVITPLAPCVTAKFRSSAIKKWSSEVLSKCSTRNGQHAIFYESLNR